MGRSWDALGSFFSLSLPFLGLRSALGPKKDNIESFFDRFLVDLGIQKLTFFHACFVRRRITRFLEKHAGAYTGARFFSFSVMQVFTKISKNRLKKRVRKLHAFWKQFFDARDSILTSFGTPLGAQNDSKIPSGRSWAALGALLGALGTHFGGPKLRKARKSWLNKLIF